MAASAYRIVSRGKPRPYAPPSASDFELEAAGTAGLDSLVAPQVSLYCVDLAREQACFVETPPAVDVRCAPFLYVAQFEHAQRLYTVGWTELIELAQRVPRGREPVMFYSVARSGGTLLGRMLGLMPGVAMILEPDCFTQLVDLARLPGADPGKVIALGAACRSFLAAALPPDVVPVFKFRASIIEIADLLGQAGACSNVFMHRNGYDCIASRLRQRAKLPPDQERVSRDEIRRYRRSDAFAPRYGDELEQLAVPLLGWAFTMERYRELRSALRIHTIRYEELLADPNAVLAPLLDHCGLATSAIPQALAALRQHSQTDAPWTPDARPTLTEGEIETVDRFLAHHDLMTPAEAERAEYASGPAPSQRLSG